jgi:hypothetical protein
VQVAARCHGEVQRASGWPCLSVNLPIRIMTKSISGQMPKKPPNVTICRIPVPTLPT